MQYIRRGRCLPGRLNSPARLSQSGLCEDTMDDTTPAIPHYWHIQAKLTKVISFPELRQLSTNAATALP